MRVFLIVGNGHSGSTLLDMILGTCEEVFSAGEVTNIGRPGLENEYCSCEERLGSCDFWLRVIKRWKDETNLTLHDFWKLRNMYERNSQVLRVLIDSLFSRRSFKKYCDANRILLETISDAADSKVVIDSSKNPLRILVLRNIVNLKILHICRDFSGVLNSVKRPRVKNIRAGIEKDIRPRKTNKVFLDWLLNNIFSEILSTGMESRKVFYADYVRDIEILKGLDPHFADCTLEKSIRASHMLAGNAIRLQKDIRISKSIGFKYGYLSKKQRQFALIVDSICLRWSRN